MRKLILALLLIGCATTPPAPNPQPVPADTYVAACANLADIGCADGRDATCAAVLQRMVEQRITRADVGCLVTAKDSAAARACGGVRCQ